MLSLYDVIIEHHRKAKSRYLHNIYYLVADTEKEG